MVVVAIAESDDTLTAREQEQLTIWKWRYALGSIGFTDTEAQALAFLTWRYFHGRCDV
ncbi:MAG: hypothetical protein NVSMB2_25460 [Chloroflexota bacterium]